MTGQPTTYDEKMLRKKYKDVNGEHFKSLARLVGEIENGTAESYSNIIKGYIGEHELGFGAILPILRIGLTGTMKGPDLFETIAFLGGKESKARLLKVVNFAKKV